MLLYEERLNQDSRWALSQGSKFFEERSAVQDALYKITERLTELGIPYAVAGGMSLFFHGYRRFTDDVDILVRAEDIKRIHSQLEGRGYLAAFPGSKNLRDTDLAVRIEFLVSGQYPGDGKPKPVAFPDPIDVALEKDGVRYLNLPTLIELKLSSGMTNNERLKDLSDVQELIKLLGLHQGYAEQLNPYVRAKFRELCANVSGTAKIYRSLWPVVWPAGRARNIELMIELLPESAAVLEAMRADGVQLEPDSGPVRDEARLITNEPEIAKKYDMHEAGEFLEDIGGED